MSPKPIADAQSSPRVSRLAASQSTNGQAGRPSVAPHKEVRHSDVVVYIPPRRDVDDLGPESADHDNKCAERVKTKPKSRKSKGYLPDSEVGCVVCVVGTWVLIFMAFCFFYV